MTFKELQVGDILIEGGIDREIEKIDPSHSYVEIYFTDGLKVIASKRMTIPEGSYIKKSHVDQSR